MRSLEKLVIVGKSNRGHSEILFLIFLID